MKGFKLGAAPVSPAVVAMDQTLRPDPATMDLVAGHRGATGASVKQITDSGPESVDVPDVTLTLTSATNKCHTIYMTLNN